MLPEATCIARGSEGRCQLRVVDDQTAGIRPARRRTDPASDGCTADFPGLGSWRGVVRRQRVVDDHPWRARGLKVAEKS